MDIVQCDYLKRWAAILRIATRPGVERVARSVAGYLLHSGFSATYLYRWLQYQDKYRSESLSIADLIEEVYYLDIDSRDRDRIKWPTPHHYRIKFQGSSDDPNTSGKVYRNIKSVELISLCAPNTNNVLTEKYLLRQVD